MSFVPDIIVVTSDEPWSKTWHTQLLYSDYLSRNFKVIYVNPPTKWRLKKVFRLRAKETKLNTNLDLVNYVNIFPSYLSLFRKLNERRNQRIMLKRLRTVGAKNVLIWHFDSYRSAFDAPFFTKAFSVKRVYHVIDPYMKNRLNNYLSKASDLIVVTSPRNLVYYQQYEQKLINIPQCIDLEKTLHLLERPGNTTIAKRNEFLVLLGTISNDIQFEWITNLLKKENFHLLMIGKMTSQVRSNPGLKRLMKMETFHILSEMLPEEFYPVITKAKAGLIIYNEKRRAKAFSPLKAINYIAAGIPVITNSDCEIEELKGKCIHMTETEEDFIALTKSAMEGRLAFDRQAAGGYLNTISLKKATETILSEL